MIADTPLKAMILAAGRGERMRPLTDSTPKPLLLVRGKPLIVHTIERLASAGMRDLVVNYAHLGGAIVDCLGNGERLGVRITYSPEPEGGLETGGGIRSALHLLDSEVFAVINGDIWTDYPFEQLPRKFHGMSHLVLVDNPPHHPKGDFCLDNGTVSLANGSLLTFSGIGVYRRGFFANQPLGRYPLAPMLRAAIVRGEVGGEHYRGRWYDIGTPERLGDLDRQLAGN